MKLIFILIIDTPLLVRIFFIILSFFVPSYVWRSLSGQGRGEGVGRAGLLLPVAQGTNSVCFYSVLICHPCFRCGSGSALSITLSVLFMMADEIFIFLEPVSSGAACLAHTPLIPAHWIISTDLLVTIYE